MDISIDTIAGFFTGAGVSLLLLYLYFRKGKKYRRFDERYERIHTLARNVSWSLTLVTLTAMWITLLLMEGPKLAFYLVLSAYIVLLLSYMSSVFILNRKL
ncbi:hypothetical protein [Sporosarcina trichiuri]|uniref:hypothetical protein n=1 Tax=Sporosarcina trichiuri TaxID=3056445 RepID=UPI0025B4E644|nr:hypothetical protein [Sporosarcina sp. 0.2-SM1T-5]WJY27698.1 hypothetical protein QWT68_01475 [Sporosarcina sp. 0.2-SM1T-5]